MEHHGKRTLALLTSLLLALTLGLTACDTNANESSSPTEADAATTQTTAEASSELVGKPWATGILQNNLPAEQPAAKDDLYTHYAHQFLSDHQAEPVTNVLAYAAEIPGTATDIINDTSASTNELDQLRIFYQQAADVESLKATGLSEILPHLDSIDAVTSIEELNALLASDEFPFSPFVVSLVATNDIRKDFVVGVLPNLLFADPVLMGGTHYQDTDNPETQQGLELGLMMSAQYTMMDFAELGMEATEAGSVTEGLIDFERRYGKFSDYPGKFQAAEYGAQAQATIDGELTLDQMCALCPNFPLKETLEKCKKANARIYNTVPDWLTTFNTCWTDENLDTLKKIATGKVMQETRPYRDPSTTNETLKEAGAPIEDAATFAYKACDSLDTFANVMAKSYVDHALGTEAKDRITRMCEALLNEYRDLASKTTWIGEESKANLLAKVDNMTLNILEPTGGYVTYDDLELTPTEDGGTLFGNYLKLKQYRIDRESELVSTPARAIYAWLAIAPTVANAFYDPSNNSINIYPGYVTSLIHAPDMSEADLLASLGFTIAHEISHAFDYPEFPGVMLTTNCQR